MNTDKRGWQRFRFAFSYLCSSVCICGSVFLFAPTVAHAEQTSALINQQLDQPFELTLKDSPLPEALKKIGNATGVRIDPTESVYSLLPWGEQTTINAKIANQSLRDALTAIARKLGLMFVLKDDYVELRPVPALARLGRRATMQELGVLDTLSSTPLSAGSEHMKIPALLEAVDQKLVETKSPFAIENRLGDRVNDRVITVGRNATLSDALEAIAQQTEGTWYPWEKSIVIVPKEEQIRNQLNKTISVRWDSVDIEQVLQELSTRSGVPFSFEAGAIQRVPIEFRKVRLFLQEVPIKQALETLSSVTGLGYSVTEDGVYIWNAAVTSPAARDPIVAMIQLKDGSMLLLPQSKVPADVREYLNQRINNEIDKLRQQMKEEGFRPTTQPATHPAREDL
jgi:type II secretory pathway component GspD/PulD (secretin)